MFVKLSNYSAFKEISICILRVGFNRMVHVDQGFIIPEVKIVPLVVVSIIADSICQPVQVVTIDFAVALMEVLVRGSIAMLFIVS